MSTPQHLVIEWLSRSHRDPEQAKAEWRADGVAVLEMGRRLAAIRIPGALVHAALQTDTPADVAEQLADRLGGPVIYDVRQSMRSNYYALIHAHTGLAWDLEHLAACLGEGVYLGVPAPHRTEPPGPYWIVPPRFDGNVCRPNAIRALVNEGARMLEPADTSR
ncbi:hypothetical protein [Streptomyces anandii]|uniref:hypothetical protein n=1 Tax=Streptomyces anandii TaxID=285454 RepID=UPI0037A783AD